MPDFVPTFKLYNSSDSYLYLFPLVNYTNAPQSSKKNTIISGKRGKGCIIIEGAEEEWDLIIHGVFTGENYTEITQKIDELEGFLTPLTPLKIKIEKNDPSETGATVYEYNIKRIEPIAYPESLRTNFQEYQIIVKSNAW